MHPVEASSDSGNARAWIYALVSVVDCDNNTNFTPWVRKVEENFSQEITLAHFQNMFQNLSNTSERWVEVLCGTLNRETHIVDNLGDMLEYANRLKNCATPEERLIVLDDAVTESRCKERKEILEAVRKFHLGLNKSTFVLALYMLSYPSFKDLLLDHPGSAKLRVFDRLIF